MKEQKILIADYEEDSRMYVANILGKQFPKFHILFATSASEILFLIKKENIDIILLGIELPDTNGLKVLELIRTSGLKTPVIFISRHKQAELIQQAFRLGAIDYINKPVNTIELDGAVRKALNIDSLHEVVKPLLDEKNERIVNKIRLNTSKGVMFFDPNEIIMFTSNRRDAYAVFYTENSNLLVRSSLVNLMKLIPKNVFYHINRQCIVNLNYVKGVNLSQKSILLTTNNLTINPVSKQFLNFLTK